MDPAAGGMRVIVIRAPASQGGVERPMNRNQTGPEPLVAVPGQLMFVLGGVLLSRTLAGAVPSALSGLASGFGMDTGRFPVAVTTETTTWAVRQCVLVILLSGRLSTHTRACAWCVWLVVRVGCGPYSGRFAFLSCAHPPPHVVCGVCWGVVVCVGLLVPVSSQTVTGLPLLAYQPSSLLGAYQKGQVLLVETLS